MNMEFRKKLPTSQEIKDMYPLSESLMELKEKNDEEVKNIFLGKDNRLCLIIGPCYEDREDAVIEYISRLRNVQEKVKDKIVIVPRRSAF